LTRRVAAARQLLVIVGWLLAAAVLVQIFLAGRAIFVSPDLWQQHRTFVHTFEWLSPLAVVLVYLGRTARLTKVLAWLTVVLLFLQYATAGTQSSLGRAGLAAIHPVSAVLLFWAAVELARRARADQRRDSSPTDTTRPAAG
jgi:putative tricarboxylic transport membrane protein